MESEIDRINFRIGEFFLNKKGFLDISLDEHIEINSLLMRAHFLTFDETLTEFEVQNIMKNCLLTIELIIKKIKNKYCEL